MGPAARQPEADAPGKRVGVGVAHVGRAIRGSRTDARGSIQTNNVEVDERGFVYIVDRAGSGLHILKLEGKARDIADFSKAVTN